MTSRIFNLAIHHVVLFDRAKALDRERLATFCERERGTGFRADGIYDPADDLAMVRP